MTLSITHAFVSAKGDGADATLVRPSNWNAGHTTSMANNQILGNTSGGTGPILEIPATAFALAALSATDGPSFLAALGLGGFSTGDCKHSINPTALTGWIAYSGGAATIGDATSAATVRANADCSNLFQMIWNQITNTYCPVTGGRGASAAADFAAHKQITLPWFSGRAVIGAGASAGLTTWAGGVYGGEETHVLTMAEMPTHRHSAALYDPGHTHTYDPWNASSGGGGSTFFIGIGSNPGGGTTSQPTYGGIGRLAVWDGVSFDVTYQTGGTGVNGVSVAHNNIQPSIGMWTHLKL